jgi:hypothetical protein
MLRVAWAPDSISIDQQGLWFLGTLILILRSIHVSHSVSATTGAPSMPDPNKDKMNKPGQQQQGGGQGGREGQQGGGQGGQGGQQQQTERGGQGQQGGGFGKDMDRKDQSGSGTQNR